MVCPKTIKTIKTIKTTPWAAVLVICVAVLLTLTETSTALAEYIEYDMIEVLSERGEMRLEDVDEPTGTIIHTPIGTVMKSNRKNHAWQYFFELDRSRRHELHWSADLEVMAIEGLHWVGVTLDMENAAVAFRVNRRGRGQLAMIRNGIEAAVVDEFRLPRDAARRVLVSFLMSIEYDVRTRELICRVDGEPVRVLHLPYYGIPAFATVVGSSMEVATEAKVARPNVTTFGSLILRGGKVEPTSPR